MKTISDVSLFLFLSWMYENADQFLLDEDVGIIDAAQIHFQNPKSQITIKLYSAKSQIPNPKLF